MNPAGVLDDYLQELLLDATAPAAASLAQAVPAASVSANDAAADTAPMALTTAADAPAPAAPAPDGAASPLPAPAAAPAVAVAATTVSAPAPAPAATVPVISAPVMPAPVVPVSPAPVAAVAATPPAPVPSVPIPASSACAAAPAPAAVPARPPAARPAPAPLNAWNELQAQAQQLPREQRQRRAAERTSRWLRLRCGGQAYALELLKVQEVVLPVPLLALRGAGSSMLGIMNLRGQVVPVIDLGLHLGAGAIDSDSHTRIVVLEEAGETLGLRVSAVEDVTSLTDSQIEPPDTTRICQISNDLFKGIARLAQRPMILLDASRLLH